LLRLSGRQQGRLKGYCSASALQPNLLSPTAQPPGFIPVARSGGHTGEPLEGLEWLPLKPGFYVFVLALALKSMPDIVTTNQIRKTLGLKPSNKYGLNYYIKSAIRWGLLRPITKRGKIVKEFPNIGWVVREYKVVKGFYKVDRDKANYVASLIPMNPGKKAKYLNNKGKLQHGLFRLAVSISNEFKVLSGGARVLQPDLWLAGEERLTSNTSSASTALDAFLLAPDGHKFFRPQYLQVSFVLVADRFLFPAVVLGNGTVYLIMDTIRGGAQSYFPCVRVNEGGHPKHLCAGSPSTLQQVLAYGPITVFHPYGGRVERLVVDTGKRGLVPYDSAPDKSPHMEVGVQLVHSTLQYCQAHGWHLEVTSYKDLPPLLKGRPAVVLKGLEGKGTELSADPYKVLPQVLYCLDALMGARRSIMRELGVSLSKAMDIARAVPLDTYADLPMGIYVYARFKSRLKGTHRWRHKGYKLLTFEDFVKLMTAPATQVFAVVDIRVIVTLPDSVPLRQLLSLGYIYVYHNDDKDPDGVVRLEFRPYSLASDFTKADLMDTFLGIMALLGVPLSYAWGSLAP